MARVPGRASPGLKRPCRMPSSRAFTNWRYRGSALVRSSAMARSQLPNLDLRGSGQDPIAGGPRQGGPEQLRPRRPSPFQGTGLPSTETPSPRMMLPIRRWTLHLVAALAFGQEAAPFPQEPPGFWQPAWELTLRGDQLSDPGQATESFRRAGAQLRLRWSWDLPALHLEAGSRSALGSDGNRLNPPRWDQQPSNGTQLDVAHAALSWVTARTFGTLDLGLQESRLLSSQALWDRDLRLLGAGGTAGVRGPGGALQEASLRGMTGRVRTILGGQVDLAAAQVVLKLD